MSLEQQIREIVKQEIDKDHTAPRLVPLQKFCNDLGLDRKTLWRAEKEGRIKVQRIGTRIFIDANQTFA